MRVLITGASGRVGRALYVRLMREHEVTGLDRAPSSTADLVGDITDAKLLERAAQGMDAIVHVAALHAPHVDRVPEAVFERINVGGTQRVLQAAQKCGVPHIVFTSTTALYGTGSAREGEAAWLTEDTPPAPRTVYHRTKIDAEQLLLHAARSGGPRVSVLRMSRCFPEPAPLMALYRLHRGIDARDVAEAHARALHKPPATSRLCVVSAATPFEPEDAEGLMRDAPAVLRQRAPALVQTFAARGWPLPAAIDRVYVPRRAEAELGWRSRHGFEAVLKQLDEESSEVLPPKMSDLAGAAT
ncbi:NAD-dependent epimerase/dehydratase family protein [Aquabacterium sp.]|uniref:NAD-dependent epimerase/dehydratase family protein n=1 Tax=Aquabacterium sp. TaxID=1872578 RepID=UPI0037830AE0